MMAVVINTVQNPINMVNSFELTDIYLNSFYLFMFTFVVRISGSGSVYCGNVKCGPFEKCEVDRITKREKCVRA